MNQTILVTGAAGFIGFHLCTKLLENGFKVIGIDNVNDYYDISLKEKRLEIIDNNAKKKIILHKNLLPFCCFCFGRPPFQLAPNRQMVRNISCFF